MCCVDEEQLTVEIIDDDVRELEHHGDFPSFI
jgi:hypothetical protein